MSSLPGPYKAYDDDALLALLANGDREAFTEIYHRYWDRLFYQAARKLNDLHAAEELVQDVFVDVWNRRNSIEIKVALDRYLVVALKYRVINYQARIKRHQSFASYMSRITPSGENTTEDTLFFNLLQQAINGIVDQLPEKCRLVFQLRQEGLSQKEIATQMNISEKTAEAHMSKALKALRKGLQQFFLTFFTL